MLSPQTQTHTRYQRFSHACEGVPLCNVCGKDIQSFPASFPLPKFCFLLYKGNPKKIQRTFFQIYLMIIRFSNNFLAQIGSKSTWRHWTFSTPSSRSLSSSHWSMFLAPGLRIWILAGKAHQGKVELTVLASAENKLEDVCFAYSRLQPGQIKAECLDLIWTNNWGLVSCCEK